MPHVTFRYLTGIHSESFECTEARLHGSWDSLGAYSQSWSVLPMNRAVAEDGCLCFIASMELRDSEVGRSFQWGVSFGKPGETESWAIPTEIKDRASVERYRAFVLEAGEQQQNYYLTHCRRLGANKVYRPGKAEAGIRFAVWAPNALHVEVVMGKIWDGNDSERRATGDPLPLNRIRGGYIADNGEGSHPSWGPFKMTTSEDGVWETDPDEPGLQRFSDFDHRPYMYRIAKNDGSVAYRTDLYSRCQIGFGTYDPEGKEYNGSPSDLDGKVGCSVVVDPERVTRYFREEKPWIEPEVNGVVWPERHFIGAADFWKDEFTERKLPARVEDLVIYELFVGSLDFGNPRPGTLQSAIALLDYLERLGVNAVELLPMSEFGGGGDNWGYATSHHFAIEFAGGGRDHYKFFVKECHKRGIAVILDVVYNHFAHRAERAEHHYDSDWPDYDIYYWYEGNPFQYANPDGGYVDNMSTAYAPRYHEEMVRKMFISSAVALLEEFHVDGFRVDQTTSIHSYNVLHANGNAVPDANIFGAKFLREFSRTLRIFKPSVILMAEDHSTWDQVTLPVEAGGMGFDARWYADFYHHLAGDTDRGSDCAKLIYSASLLTNGEALAMDYFAGALAASGTQRVVYSESHDEAGNSSGPFPDPKWTEQGKERTSHRSIVVASNQSPLVGETRRYAEARCRFAFGVTVLSAGTPMFLFGEEVGAERRFKYNRITDNKEDFQKLAGGTGANLFRFYSSIIRLRLTHPALRTRNIDVIYVHNANRIVAFRRWDDSSEFLVIASLNDRPFANGYTIDSGRLPNGSWREVFNSDAAEYGGNSLGSGGGTVQSAGGNFSAVLPFNGVLVFERIG